MALGHWRALLQSPGATKNDDRGRDTCGWLGTHMMGQVLASLTRNIASAEQREPRNVTLTPHSGPVQGSPRWPPASSTEDRAATSSCPDSKQKGKLRLSAAPGRGRHPAVGARTEPGTGVEASARTGLCRLGWLDPHRVRTQDEGRSRCAFPGVHGGAGQVCVCAYVCLCTCVRV